MAHGAEQNGVARLQQVDGAGRHHAAPAEEVIRAPVEILKREVDAMFARYRLEHLPGGRKNLLAHTVAGYHRNCKSSHGKAEAYPTS